jgi:hypothetical protein
MSVIFGMNENTHNLLIDSFNKHTREDAGNSFAYVDLSILTSNHKRLMYKWLKTLIKLAKVKKGEDGFYNYKMDDGSVINYKLGTDVFEFEDNDKKELLCDDRLNHCYLKSITVAPCINNSSVVIAKTIVGDYQRLHAVVEFPYRGRDFVFDWTQNIVMPSDQYNKLFKVEVLNKISGEDIRRIVLLCQRLGIDTASSIFLAFGKEIEEDIKKRVKIN